jgi:hypothetical protein
MPNFEGDISGFTVGDDIEVYRTVTIPAGQTLAKAWLTVKADLADVDGVALVQKIITPVLSATDGIIADTGASGTAILRFFLSSDDTDNLGNPSRAVMGYPYDIQVKTAAGKIGTVEIGTILGHAQVTQTIV